MKRLPKVRSGLARLRLFRLTVRLGTMGSAVLSILLWTLAAAFALDFWIRMDRLERSIVLIAVLGVVVWTIVRYLLPALKVHESDTALAMMVDTKHGMHSDLVAAIQFDDENRFQYGSTELREEVVEHTGKAAGGLNFMEGFPRKELSRRLIVFLITAAICLVPGTIYSGHTGAFLNRLLLGSARYPTRTLIKEIISPGDRVAYAHPVVFRVRAGGELPGSGEVRVELVESGLETTVKLLPDEKDSTLYVGTLNRVLDDLSYVVYLGDARSDPQRLTLIPLPRVELDMDIITPEYAREKVPAKPKSRRQVVVLEGSKVIPIVTADKELLSGTLTFEKNNRQIALERRGKSFVLDSRTGPLARVSEMVRFEVQVVDTDGLSPENPIKGTVQVSADLPPRVALAAYSRFVVPQATPELGFQAVDDYALDHLTLVLTVMDNDGKQTKKESRVIARPKNHQAGYRGSYKLSLKDLNLQKGNQVAVVIEAEDYRGQFEGKVKRSQKWVFEVTDEAGVLESMDRLSEQMDEKLDEILRAQLEAGK